jgi:predicted enzyme involved in methoxymalonyl-ACP biosynthesis
MLKCVIWDLDDTIWKGTLKNEDELILLSSAYKLIKEIDAAGIMQSIISRNNYTDAMQQLKIFNLDKYFFIPKLTPYQKFII